MLEQPSYRHDVSFWIYCQVYHQLLFSRELLYFFFNISSYYPNKTTRP